jgi:hypothetical protein
MLIEINDHKRVTDIQGSFRKMFPWLTIGFFVHRGSNAGTYATVNGLRTLGELRTVHNSEMMTITPSMTVAELERVFLEHYGLSVKIFRKSGSAWIEASLTGNWTLAEQNSEGRILSSN